MNPPSAKSNLEDLARYVHTVFVANHWAHAEQLDDGKYNTVEVLSEPRMVGMQRGELAELTR
jgi:hypothetical protein